MVRDRKDLRRSRRLRAAASSSSADTCVASSKDATRGEDCRSSRFSSFESSSSQTCTSTNGSNKISMTWKDLEKKVATPAKTPSRRRKSTSTTVETPCSTHAKERSIPLAAWDTPEISSVRTMTASSAVPKSDVSTNDTRLAQTDDSDRNSTSEVAKSTCEVVQNVPSLDVTASRRRKVQQMMRSRVVSPMPGLSSSSSSSEKENGTGASKSSSSTLQSRIRDSILQGSGIKPHRRNEDRNSSEPGRSSNIRASIEAERSDNSSPFPVPRTKENRKAEGSQCVKVTRKSREVALQLAGGRSRRNRQDERNGTTEVTTASVTTSVQGRECDKGTTISSASADMKFSEPRDGSESASTSVAMFEMDDSPEKVTVSWSDGGAQPRRNSTAPKGGGKLPCFSSTDESEGEDHACLSSPPPSPRTDGGRPTRRLSCSNKTRTPDGGRPTRRLSCSNKTRTPLKQLPLSVQRERTRKDEKGTEQKQHKSAKSPGGDGTRRNLDKRTARLRYSDDFRADIVRHRQDMPHLNDGQNHEGDTDLHERGKNGVTIFVRKRPIFDYEIERGDYDVVSIDSATRQDSDTVILHNCKMHPDMKNMFVKPMSFPCTAAFDEYCSNDSMYQHVAQPLVNLAARGGVATILMYGQTGSGKTHTMTGIEERAVTGLFQALESFFCARTVGGNQSDFIPAVGLQFVELCGKSCRDLLGRGLDVKLADSDDGSVRLVNASSYSVTSPTELSRLMAKAKSRRATEATDVNGVSSRSHAVCQISVKLTSSTKNARRGLLTLIDCAGSERRQDSLYHSSERQKESTEINASLYALKECIRSRALNNAHGEENRRSSAHVPYRSSSLTRLLRESFERDGARLCVIATVAPNATDTEHSMETLKTVSNIVGFEDLISEGPAHAVTPISFKKRIDLVPPKNWDHDQLVAFLKRKKIHCASIPASMNGKLIMRMSLPQLRGKLFDSRNKDMAEKLFKMLRSESDRVARAQLKERTEQKNQSHIF